MSPNVTDDVRMRPHGNIGFNEENPVLVHTAVGILALFSAAGVFGNMLVLYVFSRQKQMMTSTIFILTLAATDFISCLITIPFTIVMELHNYQVRWDLVCKLYHFLVTSAIPFSAFIMVAIAFDRYFCIVHPFKRTMTIPRTKMIVFVLALMAVCIGVFCSFVYGVYHEFTDEVSIALNFSGVDVINKWANTSDMLGSSERLVYTNLTTTGIIHSGICARNTIFISDVTFKGFQKIYSSLFGVCAVVVIILYVSIYQRVARRRKRLRNVGNSCCFVCTLSSTVERETTEFTTLRRETNNELQDSNDESNSKKEVIVMPKRKGAYSCRDALDASDGVLKAKLEKLRIANIRTAFMLAIVALVFIVSFLPAWLIALRAVDMNVIVFYMYFLYNVANPVIYAFMNPNFRNQLKAMLEQCR
ncbi:hypothetical protein ACJMK2_008237 [Sinanodonta woodiana]|uniref:G-protein coupled receptors family 1 profile domain-containing protein n=1 Tax=Sinanodonta woodiana TaxID=1069815 RepID=A0ABD3VP88_SINWO